MGHFQISSLSNLLHRSTGEVAVNSSDLGTGWQMVVRSKERNIYILIARPLNRDTPTNIEYGKIWGYMGIPTGDGDLWYGFRIEKLKSGFMQQIAWQFPENVGSPSRPGRKSGGFGWSFKMTPVPISSWSESARARPSECLSYEGWVGWWTWPCLIRILEGTTALSCHWTYLECRTY